MPNFDSMVKTTIYLPEPLKRDIEREAKRRGTSEAELIRQALSSAVSRPRPQWGLIEASQPIADRVDELLDGFGER